MSINNYIAAKLRGEDDRNFRQIKTSVPERCDHSTRICPTAECVNSWSLDYQLFFRRNEPGRRYIEILRIDDAALTVLEAEASRPIDKSHDPVKDPATV